MAEDFFLALEQLDKNADNYAQRVSRSKFYQKNGLQKLCISIKEGNVMYDAMGFGGEVKPEEYREMMKKLYRLFSSQSCIRQKCMKTDINYGLAECRSGIEI